jgi:hypothetical protein
MGSSRRVEDDPADVLAQAGKDDLAAGGAEAVLAGLSGFTRCRHP